MTPPGRCIALIYWQARALKALGSPEDARPFRADCRDCQRLRPACSRRVWGLRCNLPPKAPASTREEIEQANSVPGLQRSLALVALGLRSEGVREWNYSIRGLGDRELLAAAQLACDREVWDRCINTSDRTRAEIDIEQRFPTPLRRTSRRGARRSASTRPSSTA